ncbi:uncharacterized protein CLAFUR5_06847 [Fulvia fulva]|uniref:F-box domain-containing protein n=1 Tax=Passalora fulva TaxID=5499 RepID=A0A9Q8PAR5_PASFU|nr:uncharacterized protein CLAFUR5_06847 [Fulvia fulva]KAK4622532.1 hypothetical protein CLAFUR0_06707 [Fulvia fulva]UJO19018.1 hypothetical protein CLAFUR5_06847 [Fulvia fulva]
MSEPCEFTMAATEPVPTTMSTEELARGLLERLAAGGKLSHTTSTSLTTALASAISYRPESNTTAAHDVFHIPELLESILINNNLTTITTCQRVSRQFQATIASSAKLQCGGKKKSKTFKPELNPLLSDPTFCTRHAINAFTYELREDKDFRLLIDITFGTLAQLRALKPGGWQKLLLVQPASKRLDRWNLSFTYGEGKFTRSVGRGTWWDAVTLGEMVEVLLERWEELEGDPWMSVSEWDPERRDVGKGREHGGRKVVAKSEEQGGAEGVD